MRKHCKEQLLHHARYCHRARAPGHEVPEVRNRNATAPSPAPAPPRAAHLKCARAVLLGAEGPTAGSGTLARANAT
jgi:hypothetical protein